jgi:hypothetical protein
VRIVTFEQLINVGAGRQFTVSKTHQRKSPKRKLACASYDANNTQLVNKIVIDNIEEVYKKEKSLKEIKIDPVNWITYFIDEQNGEKWIEERLYPEMQAGGPP